MFSNNIKSFILLNIYFLIIVDIFLILSIYFQIIKGKVKTKLYEKALIDLKPKVLTYIESGYKLFEIENLLKNDFTKNIVIDIMVEYSEKNDADLSEKFIILKLDSFLIDKLLKRVNIVYLKKLAFMRVETAYDILLKIAASEDLDICYMSFFALSLIRLSKEKKEIVIKKLVTSTILNDRIIEILNKFDLYFEEWLELLEKEETSKGKVIYIKNLSLKKEMKYAENSDRILKFLKDEKEVKIAAILALCNSKNEKYMDDLIKEYENGENWQARVAVAKGLCNFKLETVKDILLIMTNDNEWWVRYNAIKSIVAMGDEGLFTLIDLSLEVDDKNVSDLAYYFLNSNKDVYNIVKNIEV
jgi:hypothetical protein